MDTDRHLNHEFEIEETFDDEATDRTMGFVMSCSCACDVFVESGRCIFTL